MVVFLRFLPLTVGLFLLPCLFTGEQRLPVQSSAQAGTYDPAEPFLFPAMQKSPTGLAIPKPLAFNDFRILMGDWFTLNSPQLAKKKQELDARYKKLLEKPTSQWQDTDIAAIGSLGGRLGYTDEVINRLQPLARGRGNDSALLQLQLASAHILRGEYREAFEHQFSACRDFPFPKSLPKHNQEQLDWLQFVEKNCLLKLLKLRKGEAQTRERISLEPDALFPLETGNKMDAGKPASQPLFRGSEEDYASRQLAPELINLAADDGTLAILQQLVYWYPADSRLYWQLGEMYFARGEIEAAVQILDECVDAPRNYAAPLLMDHRQGARKYLQQVQEKKREEERLQEENEAKEKARANKYIAWVVGPLALLITFFALRDLIRRIRQAL